jgi:hypothetical protein
MHSTRHFEILCCFCFHRGVGRKPASLPASRHRSIYEAAALAFDDIAVRIFSTTCSFA